MGAAEFVERVNKMKKVLKITLIIVGVLVVLLALAAIFTPPLIANAVYKDNFGQRFETYEPTARSLDEFEGLHLAECTFESDKGQKLAGYKYYRDNEPKGVVVMAHGFGGGGHNDYMGIADYFTTCGYVVFAYDATGNDKSEGYEVGGLPQGVIDLDYALRFVESSEEFSGLPIMLWGHSWGAYSVGSVLAFHPEVKAAVMVSGFDKSADMIEFQGREMAGDAVDFILPYINKIEEEKFGKYASASCIEGFEKSDTAVMIVHSRDDSIVPYANSFQKFYDKYNGDPRFEFVSFEDKGHNYICCSDSAVKYREEFNRKFDEDMEAMGGFTPERKAEYLKENLDKKRRYALDEELMKKMSDLYDNNLQ